MQKNRRRKNPRAALLPQLLLVLVLCAAATGIFILTSGLAKPDDPAPADSSAVAAGLSEPAAVQPVEPEPEPVRTLRFVAAGDNLIHDNLYKQASARAGGEGYDFDLPYQYVARLFAGADVAFYNQETIIAESILPLSGYPLFNSPEAIGDKMVSLGFNVVDIANNHMFDQGERGLLAALDFWEAKRAQGVLTIGAWRNEQAMQTPLLFEKNGITISFVPMTEHTNGLKLPADTDLRFIRTDEYDLMEQQVRLARQNSDFVVVTPHWGTENSNNTNDNQLMLAQKFADWGVDLVLGHHSHTLQPMEWRTGAGGNRTLVVYSLGNLIGSMLNPQNMLGGVLDLTIEKDGDQTRITDVLLTPTVIQYDTTNRRDVRIYPFAEYTDELVKIHGMTEWHPYFSRKYLADIIQKNIPAAFLKGLDLDV